MEIAKAAGFAISVEEVERAQTEVSDEELEAAAGGSRNRNPTEFTCNRRRLCF